MKTFVIISCLFVAAVLIVNPVQAVDFYYPEPWTTAYTYDDYCDMYATEAGDDPDWWQAKPTLGYLKFRHYWWSGSGWSYNDLDAPIGATPSTIFNVTNVDYTHPGYPGTGIHYGNVYAYCCLNGTVNCAGKWPEGGNYTILNTTRPLVANFVGTPLSGAAPLYVMFDDTSENEYGTCEYNWTLTPASGIAAGATGTLENHSASFSVPGNYTVSHGVSCDSGGSNISTKTDYIVVYNATTDYITTHFVVMDEPRWAQLAGSTINMLDIENNSWVNVSSSATGYEGITTLNNHTISAFASMTGYNDDELLAQPAWSGGDYRLLLFPENYGNVSAGNVTVYVSVYDTDLSSNEGRVADAAVNMAYVSGSDRVNDYRITDDAGMVSFVVPNQTTIYLYAEKAGYTRGGTTISSGNGNGGSAAVYAEITIGRTSVTTAPTVTTLPGGGTPAPTVDPYPCDADHPENCKRKQTEMGNTLIQYGPQLLLLFIIATFVGVIKMMGK